MNLAGAECSLFGSLESLDVSVGEALTPHPLTHRLFFCRRLRAAVDAQSNVTESCQLELRTDGHALVPPRDPTVLFDAAVREDFGIRDPLVVLVETSHPDGIYNAATLKSVHISR